MLLSPSRIAYARVKVSLVARVLLVVLTACTWSHALAQGSGYSLRETVGIGILTSNDQVKFFKYDKPPLLGGIKLGRSMLPWLELQVGVEAAAFRMSQPGQVLLVHVDQGKKLGGLLDLTLGTLLRVERRGLSPYASASLGAGLTGKLVRPYLSITVGLDLPLGGRQRIGPVVGYSQLVQPNGIPNLTDARFVWFGLSLRQDLSKRPKPVKKPQSVSPPRRQPIEVELARPEPAQAEPPAEPSAEVLELMERALPPTTHRVELLAPVLFRYDSDKLEPTGVAMLHEVSHTLEARPDIKLVQVAGFADKRGDAEYNRALSRRRAERVQAWLIEHGIAPERLQVEARGASEFVEPGTDDASHEQNRRVIFRVLEQERSP
ncbi:MAG: Flagellar motor rotation protein MotB [Myxococcaceae bacterium]|nr:Flagellar motor rotation protein MotB [Myxococcaceae bacterium]